MVTVDSCQSDEVESIGTSWWTAMDRQTWDEHFKSLTDFFHRKIHNRDQAEDLAQNTFLTALSLQFDTGRSQYDCVHDRLAAWLNGIGKNILKAHWAAQTKHARKLMLARELARVEQQDWCSREPVLDAEDIANAIEQELQRCNESDRQTVRQWLSGATYAQIHSSDPTHQVSALHKRVSRFTKRLKARLAELQNSSDVVVIYESKT